MATVKSKIKDKHFPLLETKLHIPQPRTNLVQRTDLIKLLNSILDCKLTLISAPAGFGKTTLLSEWISQIDTPVAWISLDKGDNCPFHFINYLVAALRNIKSDIGESTLIMLQSPQPPDIESILTNLIREITDISSNSVIALDDYHLIDTEKIHNIIEFLLDHLPSKIRIVISTRIDPQITLARLRAQNQLTELRAKDLCFTTDEITLFFNTMMNLELSNQEISILESRTEGWIAGLQLAALSMQGREDIPAFIKTFAGDNRHIVDYLAEEVLNLQSESVRDFLLQTSILTRLSEPLCDFVTGSKGSQKMLEDLEKANLFIIPLDNRRCWYRYHHLFVDLLRQRLLQTQGKLVTELHIRASKWFEKNDLIDEAVENAIHAEYFERAIYLIEQNVDSMWTRGEHTKLRYWLEKLPDELISSKPQLCIYKAWYLFTSGRHDAAERVLRIAEQAGSVIDNFNVTARQDDGQLPYPDLIKLKGRAATVRAYVAGLWGGVPDIIEHAQKALEYLPEQDLSWRSIASIALGDAYGFLGDIRASYQARFEATKVCKAAGNIYFLMVANLKLTSSLREQGRLNEIIEICRQQIELANENGLSQIAVVGGLKVMWGEVLAELNDLDGAMKLAKDGIPMVESGGSMGLLVWSYTCFVKILFSGGELDGVEKIIGKLEKIAQEANIPSWVEKLMVNWQIRIGLLQDKLEAACKWEKESGLKLNGESKMLQEIDFFLMYDYLLFVRIRIAQNQLNEASELLEQIFVIAEKDGRTTRLIEIMLLQVIVFQAQDDKSQALIQLERAIKIAEPGGYIRIFIDEGPSIAELLGKILETKADVPRSYVKKLLSAFSIQRLVETESGYMERITERELEVLRLIAGGLSNKQIMEELFVSLNTVKTHIKNIYNKLDVHSRTEAIVKARELNLF